MKKVAILTKPYSYKERIDFIVNYNHNNGLKIEETEIELQAWDFDDEEKLEQKQAEVRTVRNSYLKKYIDDRAKSPFMWDEVSDEEKEILQAYRKYLMDYTETEDWFEQNPKTFEEWKTEEQAEQQE